MKLNLGCGAHVVDGWTNVDYALGARLAKLPAFKAVNSRLHLFNLEWDSRIVLHDLTKRFPWDDASADAAYTSHTLEHMSRDDGRRFILECFRVLKPGASLRVVVPDLRVVVDRYVRGELKAEYVVEELGVLYEADSSTVKGRLAPLLQYPHKCMYDTDALCRLMADCGFVTQGRKPFDSAIEAIDRIEVEGRTVDAAIVEGVKP
jgi:SAM-dependent methyltransferase